MEGDTMDKKKDNGKRAVKDLTPRDTTDVKGGVLTNLANMRHEMLKAVASNLRG
jgi:methionyl-tRNA formyltransferase